MEKQHKHKQEQEHESQVNTPIWAIALVALCTVLIAVSQFLLKISLNDATGIPGLIIDPRFILGLVVVVAAGLLLTYSLKHGELSVLHPVLALGFIWVILVSVFVIGETLATRQVAGIVFIVGGVSVIGHSSRRGR